MTHEEEGKLFDKVASDAAKKPLAWRPPGKKPVVGSTFTFQSPYGKVIATAADLRVWLGYPVGEKP